MFLRVFSAFMMFALAIADPDDLPPPLPAAPPEPAAPASAACHEDDHTHLVAPSRHGHAFNACVTTAESVVTSSVGAGARSVRGMRFTSHDDHSVSSVLEPLSSKTTVGPAQTDNRIGITPTSRSRSPDASTNRFNFRTSPSYSRSHAESTGIFMPSASSRLALSCGNELLVLLVPL